MLACQAGGEWATSSQGNEFVGRDVGGGEEWLGLSLIPLSFLAVAEVDTSIVIARPFEGAP